MHTRVLVQYSQYRNLFFCAEAALGFVAVYRNPGIPGYCTTITATVLYPYPEVCCANARRHSTTTCGKPITSVLGPAHGSIPICGVATLIISKSILIQ